MGSSHAEIFQSLREDVLARLLEARGSIDVAYGRIPEDRMRQQFETVLDRMHSFLATEDSQLYRSFASRYLAMRVGEGASPENLIHSVVAIGDIIVQVAKQALGPSDACNEFVRAVVRMNYTAARLLVGLLAEDLDRRAEQLVAVEEGGEATELIGKLPGGQPR